MVWEDVTFLKRKGARACSQFQSGIKLIFLRFIWYLFACSGSIWVARTEAYYSEENLCGKTYSSCLFMRMAENSSTKEHC